MDLGLAGKAAIVTGASRGIGLASARMLAAEGAAVLLVGRSAGALETAAADCGEAGGQAAGFTADVTAPDAGERIVVECERRFGAADVLVNNAGTSFMRSLEELTDDDWRGQWELNVMAPLRLMRASAPAMAGQDGGRIVNVCSTSGKRPSLRNPAYSVTKAAELSLSRVFADAYATRSVMVNAVAPGPVESPLWMGAGGLADQIAEESESDRAAVLAEARAKVPTGRFSTPDEVAAVIVFLCSERAGNVTGAAWSADGGTVPIII